MYAIKDSKDLPGRKQPCKVGFPDLTEPDLCICDTANPFNYIPLNSTVLREALLADPDYILFTLGIKIEDKGIRRHVER